MGSRLRGNDRSRQVPQVCAMAPLMSSTAPSIRRRSRSRSAPLRHSAATSRASRCRRNRCDRPRRRRCPGGARILDAGEHALDARVRARQRLRARGRRDGDGRTDRRGGRDRHRAGRGGDHGDARVHRLNRGGCEGRCRNRCRSRLRGRRSGGDGRNCGHRGRCRERARARLMGRGRRTLEHGGGRRRLGRLVARGQAVDRHCGCEQAATRGGGDLARPTGGAGGGYHGTARHWPGSNVSGDLRRRALLADASIDTHADRLGDEQNLEKVSAATEYRVQRPRRRQRSCAYPVTHVLFDPGPRNPSDPPVRTADQYKRAAFHRDFVY